MFPLVQRFTTVSKLLLGYLKVTMGKHTSPLGHFQQKQPHERIADSYLGWISPGLGHDCLTASFFLKDSSKNKNPDDISQLMSTVTMLVSEEHTAACFLLPDHRLGVGQWRSVRASLLPLHELSFKSPESLWFAAFMS